MGNVVVPLLMLAGGGALVWSGITDPEGGTFGGLSQLMRGETPTKRAADPAAAAGIGYTLATVAARSGGGGGGSTAAPTASPTGSLPAPTPAPSTVPRSVYSLGAVKPWVARAANEAGPMFGITSAGGYRASAIDPQGHPAGRAVDFMVSDARGTALAGYLLANRRRLGVTYVIWRQRINDGSGWRDMADRGSPTQNHMDHVHASFTATDPRGSSAAT